MAQPAALASPPQAASALPPAQKPRALALPAGQRVKLDGRLDEAYWSQASVMDRFYQFAPRDKRLAPEGYRTAARFVVEDDALVVGVEAFDPRPEDIRGTLVRRDEVRRDQDFVVVYLDTAGERRSAQWLRVNADGVLADGMHVADGDREDFAPDFAFEAAAQRTARGYSVELRLPLLALRTPRAAAGELQDWRVMVGRRIPRSDNMLVLSVPLTQDTRSFIAELQPLDGIQGPQGLMQRAQESPLFKLTPEFTARHTREGQAKDSRLSAGLNLKWRPRADWVIDATLNPDFAQVELDAPQLAGNTRFALSVPEKRPFFLESTDILDLPAAAFYSRAVTDPRYGVRATWRGQDADATALSLQDRGGGLVLRPGAFGTDLAAQDVRSQATLLRYRRHLTLSEGAQLTAGVLLNQRSYADVGDNRVLGMDVAWQPRPSDQFWLRALQSRSSAGFGVAGELTAVTPESGSRWQGHWQHKSERWIFNADAGRTSPRFRNDNGFVERSGIAWAEVEVIRRYGERPMWLLGFPTDDLEWFVWTRRTQTVADTREAVSGGQTLEQRFHPGVWWAGAKASEGHVLVALDHERVRPGGALHATRSLELEYGLTPSPTLTRLYVEARVGQMVDVQADRVTRGADLALEAKWRARWRGMGLEAEQRLNVLQLRKPDGGVALNERATRVLAVLHFTARDSLRAVWQGSRYRRAAEAGWLAEDGGSRSSSLVFQHRVGPGRSWSLGASRNDRSGAPTAKELFAKKSFEI